MTLAAELNNTSKDGCNINYRRKYLCVVPPAPLTRRRPATRPPSAHCVGVSALKVTRRLRAVFSKAAAAEIGKLLQRRSLRCWCRVKIRHVGVGHSTAHQSRQSGAKITWLSLLTKFSSENENTYRHSLLN